MPLSTPPVAAQKASLRAEMRVRRTGFDPQAGKALTDLVLAQLHIPAGATVAGTWPLPGEIDLRPLIAALHARGCRVVLPETPPRGEALTFRRWQPGCVMRQGRFGTQHPEGCETIPDILFVPLLAFDRCGRRLGYGGGYYDRTLAKLPDRLAIGFGYAGQEVDAVPADASDRALSVIVTEREVVETGKKNQRACVLGGTCRSASPRQP